METVIPIFELAFLALFVLLYLLAPLLSYRRGRASERWSLLVFIWVLALSGVLFLLMKFQTGFYVDSIAFWCVVVALLFEVIHCVGEAWVPNELVSEEEVSKVVLEEVSRYLDIPISQIARDCNLLSLKENSSETDIWFLIFLTEKKLGIHRSRGISEIRTVNEMVAYLCGEDINAKLK